MPPASAAVPACWLLVSCSQLHPACHSIAAPQSRGLQPALGAWQCSAAADLMLTSNAAPLS